MTPGQGSSMIYVRCNEKCFKKSGSCRANHKENSSKRDRMELTHLCFIHLWIQRSKGHKSIVKLRERCGMDSNLLGYRQANTALAILYWPLISCLPCASYLHIIQRREQRAQNSTNLQQILILNGKLCFVPAHAELTLVYSREGHILLQRAILSASAPLAAWVWH